MNLNDYQDKLFDDFMGFWSRGANDQVPLDHFSDCLNLELKPGQAQTRNGLSKGLTGGENLGILRWHLVFGVGTFILYSNGDICLNTAATPILASTGATDFSLFQFFSDRIYIGLHDGVKGLSGSNLKVYVPSTGEIRDAAGPAIGTAVITAANGAASTLMNAGVYNIAVVGETSTGFLTPLGPLVTSVFTPTSYTSPGAVKISLSTIPTGPSYIVKRHLIITKANETEYFFLPTAFGGVINDNVTTTATLDFNDITDLVSSADYLLTILPTIGAPLKILEYKGRMATIGEYANRSIVRFSNPGDPETYDAVDSICNITENDEFSMQNAFVDSRDLFIACKSLGVHLIVDSGDVPATWGTIPIDETVNVPIWGITQAVASGTRNSKRGHSFIVDRSGILFYNGSFSNWSLTLKIDDLWQQINWQYYNKIVLVDDVKNKRIFVAFPTGASTVNNNLLMGDYSACIFGFMPDFQNIRWCPWKFHINPESIGISVTGSDVLLGFLKVASSAGRYIYALDTTKTDDDGTAIESYVESPLVTWKQGAVHYFTAFRLRITGSGNLQVTVKGEDGVNSANLFTDGGSNAIVLSTTPGQEILKRFNFQNEKAKFKFRLASGNFILSTIQLYGKAMFTMRPM